MTKKEKEQWLEAIEALIAHYERWGKDKIPGSFGITYPFQSCPLCAVKIRVNVGEKSCPSCPWVRFEGHLCLENDNNGKDYADYPTGDRLRRLRRWKRKIKKED